MNFDYAPSRRVLLAGAGALAVSGCATASSSRPAATLGAIVQNPLVPQRADAQIVRNADGQYYMMASVPEYDRLIIRRSKTLAGLRDAEEAVVWRRPSTGKLGGYIWAPELHNLDGRWFIYFAAGDAGEPFHIRTYVLQCKDRDPLTGSWELLGQLQTPWDTFTLDSTIFEHKGVRYLCWAQKEPGINTNSNLYLAPLATPTTLARQPVRLTVPTLPWEIEGFKVAEGPAILHRNGRLFLTYSGSATDARYCMGMLTADENADIMSAEAWTKSPSPVFVSNEATSVYGPGHNSFTVDEEGRDLLVFHGRSYKAIKGDPLFDPNRDTRVQRVYYRPDGTPDFGVPVGAGEIPDRFSPVDQPNGFLQLEGESLRLGQGPLATTQIRRRPGFAGADTVSLEPILAPGKVLRRLDDGRLALASREEVAGYAQAASFRMVKGLAGGKSVSFAAVGGESAYLRHAGGNVSVGAAGGEPRSASFILS